MRSFAAAVEFDSTASVSGVPANIVSGVPANIVRLSGVCLPMANGAYTGHQTHPFPPKDSLIAISPIALYPYIQKAKKLAKSAPQSKFFLRKKCVNHEMKLRFTRKWVY